MKILSITSKRVFKYYQSFESLINRFPIQSAISVSNVSKVIQLNFLNDRIFGGFWTKDLSMAQLLMQSLTKTSPVMHTWVVLSCAELLASFSIVMMWVEMGEINGIFIRSHIFYLIFLTTYDVMMSKAWDDCSLRLTDRPDVSVFHTNRIIL